MTKDDPLRTHLFGGYTIDGEVVCSPDCWCKTGEEK